MSPAGHQQPACDLDGSKSSLYQTGSGEQASGTATRPPGSSVGAGPSTITDTVGIVMVTQGALTILRQFHSQAAVDQFHRQG